MALIKCPGCGKRVSDTQDKCIHCGCDLRGNKTRQEEITQYYKLAATEQQNLRKEFYGGNPSYAENDRTEEALRKKVSVAGRISQVCGGLFFALVIIGRICSSLAGDSGTLTLVISAVALISVVAGLSSAIITYVFLFRFKKYRRNELIIEKRFQRWLKVEKNINYTVSFTSKQRKEKEFFDSVNVDRTELER